MNSTTPPCRSPRANANAIAPGGVQRKIEIDSTRSNRAGPACANKMPARPPTAPIRASKLSPRLRFFLNNELVEMETHFDNTMPNTAAHTPIRIPATKFP
jgi:hypothetical protein